MATLVECWKCGGTGHIDWAAHYANGVCFNCNGSGKSRYSSPKFAEIVSRFKTECIWHQAITVAQCMTPRSQVFMYIRGVTANALVFISLRKFGKARDIELARIDCRDIEELRAAWAKAKELAKEHNATLVPYFFGDMKRTAFAGCYDGMNNACHAWVAKHAPRFGFALTDVGVRKSYDDGA